jgi:hypothetical protein
MSKAAINWLFAISFILLTVPIFLPQLLPRTGEFEPLYFGWMPSWFFTLSVIMLLNFVWCVAFWLWDGRQGETGG